MLPWVQPVYGYLLDIEHPRDPRGVRVSELQAAVVRQLFAWYDDRERSAEAGFSAHLRKPIDPLALTHAISGISH